MTCHLLQTIFNIQYSFHEGDFLDTYFENKPELSSLDFVFIDGPHESYFATFYCYEILERLRSGTLIHIHDINEPDVLLEAYQKGWYTPFHRNYPTITDEAFTVYLYLKNRKGYKVLCRASDLLEKNFEKISFIQDVENCLYRNALSKKTGKRFFQRKNTRGKDETQASSFYMIKEHD